jgi:hypothetical protein
MRLKLQPVFLFLLSISFWFAMSATAAAQSSDQALPTAVLINEISGTIPALDLGDPRQTQHYYAFEATPGDLLITVNSRNLNGDVDVFTAVTFRPLMKISIYANTIPPQVTKSLYFRTRQILILRVEARTPNDDSGAYRISFSGTFQAFSGGIPVAETADTSTETEGAVSDRKTKRLTSVGATIPEPPAEVKPEEPKAEIVAAKPPAEKPAATKPAPKPRTTRTTPPRSARTRPPRTPRSKPAQTEEAKTETSKAQTEETKPSTPEGEEKSGEKPAGSQEVPAGAHLIIEEKDGTRVDRPMSTVRRVIIEGNTIVVILKTGRVERFTMANVARMAIEP